MSSLVAKAREALNAVYDPELDEPITDLGFVHSIEQAGDELTVHLRLPSSFCSPNFAYLMASDAKDVLAELAPRVTVVLDDHHDSDLINRGLAADAGYRGTFGDEADTSLDELRLTFRRKAHAAAMERALTPFAREGAELHGLVLGDLPDTQATRALLRRREALGFGTGPAEPVLVDERGRPYPREEIPLRLRFARSIRISIEGNAHFCRGLLRTRYDMKEQAS
ncbi:Metal-sulfur cluster biosynthetic enzyme [Amycolatopsis sacchari]|uniref:Metal-sulfur cluster biosynthetic enzyme n=1 Tax=Amycolatopsis sacchari TaxID=115433 RepID=A0A1I3QYB6_9PSEU|nr:iron-sulfur cluster assembly protein [Amycolatopsis sacchari]SFJ38760.1 Metal-sulfur cluster biosynthetic enzyme [Amycolatopsis sacchari]